MEHPQEPAMPGLPAADYLGDGVYVRFDGFQFWIWTDRGAGVESIALEPSVLAGLNRYATRVGQAVETIRAKAAAESAPADPG